MKPEVRVSFGTEPPAPAPRPKVPWGWFHMPHPEPSVLEIHVLPASDLGCHAFDAACACSPFEQPESPGFIQHHAFDGREAYERGERKHH